MRPMGVWWQLAIVVVVAWFVLRFVRSLFKPREPSESVDPRVDDRLTGCCRPRSVAPKIRSGAAALAEPDEEEENRSFPPRKL